jgi:hypothetical protein
MQTNTAKDGSGTTYYPIVSSDGRLIVDVNSGADARSNTVKDGSGTAYYPIVDSDGHSQVDVLTTPEITTNTVKDGSGDTWRPIVDGDGHLQVDVLSGGTAGTQYDEDTPHVSGATGTLSLVVRSDTIGSLCGTDGDYTALQVDADGYLYVLDKNSAAILADTTSIDGKITACNTGAVTISAALPAGTNSIGDIDTVGTITNVVSVDDNASSITVDTTGTSGLEVVQATAADLNCTEANSGDIKTAVELIDDTVHTEDTAHTTGDKGIMLLGVRKDTAAALAGSDGDYIPLICDDEGKLWTTATGGGGGTATDKTGHLAVDAEVFDNTQTTYTSADIDSSGYDYAYLEIDIGVTNTPTNVVIEVLTGMSASPTHKIMDGPLGDLRYEDSAGTKAETIKVPYCGDYTRIKVTATGTDATDKFTVSVRFVGITSGY